MVYTLTYRVEPSGQVSPQRDADPWNDEEEGILIQFVMTYRIPEDLALSTALDALTSGNIAWLRPVAASNGDWLFDLDAFKDSFGDEPFSNWEWFSGIVNITPVYRELAPSFTTVTFTLIRQLQALIQ